MSDVNQSDPGFFEQLLQRLKEEIGQSSGKTYGGNKFGGNKFGGNKFGGNKFGGNKFGRSAEVAAPSKGSGERGGRRRCRCRSPDSVDIAQTAPRWPGAPGPGPFSRRGCRRRDCRMRRAGAMPVRCRVVGSR
jgi:hypothetical protein